MLQINEEKTIYTGRDGAREAYFEFESPYRTRLKDDGNAHETVHG